MRRLGEWGYLRRLLPKLRRDQSRRVLVKPGDDAAVVRAADGTAWAITTDMLVEGVHFRTQWTSGEDLGHKALAVNLSDLAAMGEVTPAFGVVSVGITPKTPVDYVDSFYRGLQKLAKRHKFDVVGGDTVRSDRLVVSVAALGWVGNRARVVLRSGAREGDVLLVTGTFGDAAAGLAVLSGKPPRLPEWVRNHLTRRFLRPEPQFSLVRRLVRECPVGAMLDSSDGLWRSVKIICEASRVGARVEAEQIPLSPALRWWASAAGLNPRDVAIAGGEDYGLVLTAPPDAARRLAERSLARPVGRVVSRRRGIKIYENGKIRGHAVGFEHFG